MKRSRRVRLALLGTAAFAVTACEERTDLTYFETLEQCHEAAVETDGFTGNACDEAFADAAAVHAAKAPRYEDLALCEAQHGEGNCAPPEAAGGAEAAEAGGGSVFMPFLMGYMMGNVLSSGSRGVAGAPLYRNARSGLFTYDGRRTGFSQPGQTATGRPGLVGRPRDMSVAKPMTRASVARTGGFGAARTAGTGGSRGFGS
ncbi:MAG: DUF1190 domain-containing protein [Paracoccaceae bacterium]